MEWDKAELGSDGTVKIPESWLHLYYYEALNVLFRFENALRVFVYVILKNELGSKWDTATIHENMTIRQETKKRINQAKEFGYLGDEVKSPMLFLNSGELIEIITSDAYWKHFARHFKASKSIVLTKLQEIGTVRNSLAHFRPIKADDIELIKQNSRHVLLEIEKCLVQITSIRNLVPTNSNDDWYKEIKAIGNEHFTTALYSSENQDWIRVELQYVVPVFRKESLSGRHFSFQLGNLQTLEILKNFHALRDNCIYVSEAPIRSSMTAECNIVCRKFINFVFSLKTLTGKTAEIVQSLKDIAMKVEIEDEVLLQDHLSRGMLIEAKSVHAYWSEGSHTPRWIINVSKLATSSAANDDVEFWGERGNYASDFICESSVYPWMPSSISNESIPF